MVVSDKRRNMFTKEQIIQMVKDKEEELNPLIQRWENDYSLFRLDPYTHKSSNEGVSGGGYENVTANDPQTLCLSVIDNIGYAPMIIKIPLPENLKERKDSSYAERFLYGCLNIINSRLQQVPMSPHLQGSLAWFSTVRGWVAVRVLVHKEEEKGPTIPSVDVWDMRNVTWDTAGTRLLWGNHKRPISKAEAKAVYDKDISGKYGVLYDFCCDTEIVNIIDGEEVYREKHGLEYPPILISAVGCTPLIASTKFSDSIKDVGESALVSNRSLYEPINKLLTLYLTIVAQGAHNPLAIYSKGGKKQFKRNPYYPGSFVQLDIDKGEKVEELYKPNMPTDTERLLSHIMQKLSIGGVPPVASGALDIALPYSGIQLLTHSAMRVLEARKYVMERTIEWICRELLSQFAQGGFKAIEVHGRDGTNEFFQCKISPKDIRGDWFPECKIIPRLPEDEMQKYNMAQMAVANQILSRRTVRDKLLNIQDTDAEEDRMLYEQTASIKEVQLLRTRRALLDQGEPELAAALMMLMQPQGQPQVSQIPQVRSYEGVKNPAFATGVRPEMLPGQMLGERRPMPQMPPEVGENFRLSQMGLTRGR